MAKWSFKASTWTPVAVADATNFTNAGYMALQGGSTTQRTKISEIYSGGQAAASAPCIMVASRDSIVGTNITYLGFSFPMWNWLVFKLPQPKPQEQPKSWGPEPPLAPNTSSQ